MRWGLDPLEATVIPTSGANIRRRSRKRRGALRSGTCRISGSIWRAQRHPSPDRLKATAPTYAGFRNSASARIDRCVWVDALDGFSGRDAVIGRNEGQGNVVCDLAHLSVRCARARDRTGRARSWWTKPETPRPDPKPLRLRYD